MIMRVTTQMINNMAKKAGLPLRGTSLLDYVKNDNPDVFFDAALNKSSAASAANSSKKTGYEKLEKAAEQLLQQAEQFTREGEDSLFERVRKSGSMQEIYDEVEDYVKKLNGAIKEMQSSRDPLSGLYCQTLLEALSENSEALGKAGITVSKNGTVVLDKEKLEGTDLDCLEKLLGTSGTLSAKVSILADKISDYAHANVRSLSQQYTSAGNGYAALFHQHDFWG